MIVEHVDEVGGCCAREEGQREGWREGKGREERIRLVLQPWPDGGQSREQRTGRGDKGRVGVQFIA